MPRTSDKTREDDDRELAMLSMRAKGHTTTVIGSVFGETSSRVRVLTNRIRDDHAAHTGEDVGGWWDA